MKIYRVAEYNEWWILDKGLWYMSISIWDYDAHRRSNDITGWTHVSGGPNFAIDKPEEVPELTFLVLTGQPISAHYPGPNTTDYSTSWAQRTDTH